MNRKLPSLRRIAQRCAGVALALAAACAGVAQASEEGYTLDHFPTNKLYDKPALQDGATTFVNYCLNCHSAGVMRYNRLKDIGLTDEQIRANLLFAGDKVGETMRIAMRPADAKAWFGAMPPDLSVEARARNSESATGADWLYTYLRTFYRDATRPTGWNNALFPNVGMPHVLWTLQGARGATITEDRASGEGHDATVNRTVVRFDGNGVRTETKTQLPAGSHAHEGAHFELAQPAGGQVNAAEYDDKVANLVAFMTYMSDPSAGTRARMGLWVLSYLLVLFAFCWWLNRKYWKDVH